MIAWSLDTLAAATGVSVEELAVFEADRLEAPDRCQRAIRDALSGAGVLFLPEVGGEGVGVRLKFPRQTVKRIQAWEGEGGTTGDDDVA